MAKALFWFRRDLRLEDNHGLFESLKSGLEVIPIFIFDQEILSRLPDRDDRRVQFIYSRLVNLKKQIQEIGSDLLIFNGNPIEIIDRLISQFQVSHLYFNTDHDPYPLRRDFEVKKIVESKGVKCHGYGDSFFFEPNQVLTEKGTPYTVFTPYSRKWRNHLALNPIALNAFACEAKLSCFAKGLPKTSVPLPSELGMNFKISEWIPYNWELNRIQNYEQTRNNVWDPHATSQIGVHLRFGTMSVRHVVRATKTLSESFISEIIWRDFFSQILFHFPKVTKVSFRQEFDSIDWNSSEADFQSWCEGRTGYPLVDAGMRQLNATGTMPNRVRMIVASFLCKDLLIHWKRGERYFAGKLLDYELSSNNGNWQWSAGTGCDAAPYFRIFSPELQLKKFDPKSEYVRRWLPEYGTTEYPEPMVDHTQAARTAISAFEKIKRRK